MTAMSVRGPAESSSSVAVGAVACALLLGGCAEPETDALSTATWALVDGAAVTDQSTTLRVGVTGLGCSGGRTGTVLDPQVRVEADQILIRLDVTKLPDGAYDCPGNDTVSLEVMLNEPIGDREVVDAACLAGEAVGTTFCLNDGVRWPL
jgi:hypothetical protein